jgi:uncharacterized protein (TIGR04255 family)
MSDWIQPDFGRPPVTETVFSAQFDPIPGLSNGHLGAFWKTLGADWAHVSDAPPLQPEFERFGQDAAQPFFIFPLLLAPNQPARLQIRSKSQHQMLQIQNTRIIFNWLRVPEREYEGFEHLFPTFKRCLEQFAGFLRSEGLPAIRFNQWEISYFNTLKKQMLWESSQQWGSLIGGFVPTRPLNDDIRLESFGGEWHFEIGPGLGRLHLNIQHGRTGMQADDEALLMRLTARGPLSPSSETVKEAVALPTSIDGGFKLGHDVIVDTFFRLTAEDAHILWERKI